MEGDREMKPRLEALSLEKPLGFRLGAFILKSCAFVIGVKMGRNNVNPALTELS